MKKTLFAMTLLAGAVSVYSQGTVSMGNYNSDSFYMQVYGIQSGPGPVSVTYAGVTITETQGNSSYGVATPPGGQYGSYNGAPGSTVYTASPLNGTQYDVGLLGVLGTVAAGNYSALSLSTSSVLSGLGTAASPTPTLIGGAGSWTASPEGIIPGTGSVYTIAIAAWVNSGAHGAASTLTAAVGDGYAWGISDMITTSLATGIDLTATLYAQGNYGTGANNLQSFSINTAVPEPSTIALGVMGASALLFRRRK